MCHVFGKVVFLDFFFPSRFGRLCCGGCLFRFGLVSLGCFCGFF